MQDVRLDHATINTADLAASVAFYGNFIGLRPGWRPPLSTKGAWLYPADGDYAIIHLIAEAVADEGGGRLNHIAFRGVDLPAYLGKLRASNCWFEATAVPQTPFVQVHHRDPNGVKVEVIFREMLEPETVEPAAQ